MSDFWAALRSNGRDNWLALLGLGIALSPTHTKIAGAAWLLICIAGAVVFFRLPRREISLPPDPVVAASKAWFVACAACAFLATAVWLYWPDRPDTLHAEFRLLLAAVATHLLILRAPDPAKWRAFTLPATALACGAAFLTIAPLPDKMLLPANPIPWAVAVAFLLCVMLPLVLGGVLPEKHRKWYGVSAGLGIGAVLLCHTRGAYGILLWALWLAATNWRRAHAEINLRKFAVAGFAGVAMLASSAWLPADPLRLRQGWNEVVNAQHDGNYNTSMGARMYSWSLAWRSFQGIAPGSGLARGSACADSRSRAPNCPTPSVGN